MSGAIVEEVENRGPVTTYGQNDMVLDNWGKVREWRALAPVTSEGPSGIGFVNFGDLETLDVRAPIATHGRGARGFNFYDGSLQQAKFASIATTGDGSVGIQVSKPMGTLKVTGDLTTTGGRGLSLVKGVQVVLEAIALSVKPGGSIRDIRIGGTVSTQGTDVPAIENDGEIGAFAVRVVVGQVQHGVSPGGRHASATSTRPDATASQACELRPPGVTSGNASAARPDESTEARSHSPWSRAATPVDPVEAPNSHQPGRTRPRRPRRRAAVRGPSTPQPDRPRAHRPHPARAATPARGVSTA